MKKIISLILVFLIITYVFCGQADSLANTGHSQKEAAETIAAWSIDFYNKHAGQCSYDFSFGYPREHSYTLPVSDADTSTQYCFDCVGWVSFAIHHAVGLGADTFTYFADPTSPSNGSSYVGEGFEKVYCSTSEMQPGDIIVMGTHVALYVGDGKSVEMWQSGLQYVDANTTMNSSGGYSYVARITDEAAKNADFTYMQGAGGTGLQMKGNKMADCAFEYDGVPGDSEGVEWQVKDWFRDGKYYAWDTVYRYPDEKVARAIATCAIQGANNDNIGYKFEGWGGGSRQNSLGMELEKVNFNLSAVTTKCDSICSLSTSSCVKAAGYVLNMDTLKTIPTNAYTSEADYPSRGFQTLTDSKYLMSCDELLAGDILVTTGMHVNIFVGNGQIGSGGETSQFPVDDIIINLDEQNFEFAGTPKTVTYSGRKKAGEWIFSLFSQFVDFIVSLVTNGIKTSILGWAMTFEGAVDTSIKFLEGF